MERANRILKKKADFPPNKTTTGAVFPAAFANAGPSPVAPEVTRLHPSSRLSHVRNVRPSHENHSPAFFAPPTALEFRLMRKPLIFAILRLVTPCYALIRLVTPCYALLRLVTPLLSKEKIPGQLCVPRRSVAKAGVPRRLAAPTCRAKAKRRREPRPRGVIHGQRNFIRIEWGLPQSHFFAA